MVDWKFVYLGFQLGIGLAMSLLNLFWLFAGAVQQQPFDALGVFFLAFSGWMVGDTLDKIERHQHIKRLIADAFSQ